MAPRKKPTVLTGEANPAFSPVDEHGRPRPLQWQDLTPEDQDKARTLLSTKTLGMKAELEKKAGGTKGTESAKFQRAAEHPDLVQEPVNEEEMAGRLAAGIRSAATGETRLPHESLAGEGFYFHHHRGLVNAAQMAMGAGNVPNPDSPEFHRMFSATAALSPQTSPTSERRTMSAMLGAHANGRVTFHRDVVQKLAQGYENSEGKQIAGIAVPQELHGKSVAFKDLPSEAVDHLRKPHMTPLMDKHSENVDWEGMRSVGLGSNVKRAHQILQGVTSHDPFANPKVVGYAQSGAHALPEHEQAYMALAQHIGGVYRGERDPLRGGGTIPGMPHGWTVSASGLTHPSGRIFDPSHPIAADKWHRVATSGQPLHEGIATSVADIFLGNKSIGGKQSKANTVGYRNASVTPVGIEHAFQQHVTEMAGHQIFRETGVRIPSVMTQEVNWAERRRAAGGDAEYNAAREAQRKQQRAGTGGRARQQRESITLAP